PSALFAGVGMLAGPGFERATNETSGSAQPSGNAKAERGSQDRLDHRKWQEGDPDIRKQHAAKRQEEAAHQRGAKDLQHGWMNRPRPPPLFPCPPSITQTYRRLEPRAVR